MAKSKNISFIISYDTQLAPTLVGDPVRISQIINNLCSNAIKFTEKGSVSLSIQRVDDENELTSNTAQSVLFEVRDTGVGISQKAQENLFKAFHQADISTSRKYGGTGLGLSICSSLSDLMGGSLSFSSSEGKGSTFSYQQTFKVSKLSIIEQTKVVKVNLEGARILVAEDTKVNQIIINKMLQAHNTEVVIVENGEEVLSYLESNSADLIFMDIQMPIMGGVEAIKNIRKNAHYHSIPIVAMTANTMKEDIEYYLSIGADGYLTKPFDSEKLNKLLNLYNPNNLKFRSFTTKISDPSFPKAKKLELIGATLKDLIPNADRVSIWLFKNNLTSLKCIANFDEHNHLTNNMELEEEDYPAYFKAIIQSGILNAADARSNEYTECFNQSYFLPLNIYSLLDYTFTLEGRPVGVICCESLHHKVEWSDDEICSLIAIADAASLTISKELSNN